MSTSEITVPSRIWNERRSTGQRLLTACRRGVFLVIMLFQASCVATPTGPLVGEVVQENAGFVIAMEFAPDGALYYATQDGGIFRKQVDFAAPWDSPPPRQLLTVPVVRGAESGLLGMALSPEFARNGHLFVYYTAANSAGKPRAGVIARYTISEDRAGEQVLLVDDLPARPEQRFHFGGGLAFGPGGRLYLIFGDTNRPELAQDPQYEPGAILRYTPEGDIPDDNPWPDSAVFASGIRNGFGLAWHPESGKLYQSDNGHRCDDELNLIEAGGNYGWGLQPFDRCPYPDDGARAPVFEWNPTIAPAGLLFYTGQVIPEWRGGLLVCSFNDLDLWLLRLSRNGRAVQSASVVSVPEMEYSCRVDIEQGPDGWLYTTTDSTIFRIGRRERQGG